MSPPSTATAAGRRRAAWVIALLALAGLAAMLAALVSGSVPIDATRLGAALVGDRTDTATAIVLELRLPRAIAAFASGGLLASPTQRSGKEILAGRRCSGQGRMATCIVRRVNSRNEGGPWSEMVSATITA